MEQNSAWLSTSLFCSRSVWNRVIREGIAPFINILSEEKRLTAHQLQFSYSCGENIRLSLLANAGIAEELAKRTDAYFKDFFGKAGLPKEQRQFPVEAVFMPFPANTIQYGLYKAPSTDKALSMKKIDFQNQLSLLMAEALGGESIDEETILTFAFYLNIAWLKTLLCCHGNRDELLNIYDYETHFKKEGQIDAEFSEAKFEDNKHMLLEITNDVLNQQQLVINNNPSWLPKWFAACEEVIEKEQRVNSGQDNPFMMVHSQTVHTINEQLGLTENMRLLVFYFVAKVFTLSEYKLQVN